MSNDWSRLRQRPISRRRMLARSAKAGVGAAGLALVGCGGDDDDAGTAAAGRAVAAAEEAAAAAAAAGEARAATTEAAADAANAVAEAADEAAAARQAAESVAVLGGRAEIADWTVPWPIDEIDLHATITVGIPFDQGGTDQMRVGGEGNYISHGAVHDSLVEISPLTKDLLPHLCTLEWADEGATCIGAVTPAMFHDGSSLTAHDLVFTYERMGGVAEYHQGGEMSDHPTGWQATRPAWGSNAVDPQQGRRRSHVGNRTRGVRRVPMGHDRHPRQRLRLLQDGHGTARRSRGRPAPNRHGPLPLRQPHGRRGLRLRALRGPFPGRSTTPSGRRTTPTTST